LLKYDAFCGFFDIFLIGALETGDTLSDTLSFSSLNLAFGRPFLCFANYLFSGLGISKCLTSDTLSYTLSFLLWYLVLSQVLFMARQENEGVIALVTSATLNDTLRFLFCFEI